MEVHQREEKEQPSSLKRREEGQCLQPETSREYEGQKEKQNLLEECNDLHCLHIRVCSRAKNLPRGRLIASFRFKRRSRRLGTRLAMVTS